MKENMKLICVFTHTSAQGGSEKNILNKTTTIEEDANSRFPLNGSPVECKRKDFIAKVKERNTLYRIAKNKQTNKKNSTIGVLVNSLK